LAYVPSSGLLTGSGNGNEYGAGVICCRALQMLVGLARAIGSAVGRELPAAQAANAEDKRTRNAVLHALRGKDWSADRLGVRIKERSMTCEVYFSCTLEAPEVFTLPRVGFPR
jgi:hypothetical protein